ncbi:DUF3870 domain-containing protein [Aquibacillus sp. 3ASR75-11]|uniref:DUF3870 domain-containing protein n=1 Tax=Terrihalobacillus insolitus TaxID=2950438 RepID=A0A9X3WUP0_9BACI|nr:DUF3870 domain-containing protein [Terrihalobacillus insolitus]MDC3413787.1 DUF3870 domain-containing protein [Terrihalobacillus insolitus]MDC3425955.1 DUF3870 domain-containing protein [Terrihalobacillus insolitus]
MGIRNTVICTGYSKLPDGMAAKNLYGVMGVGLEVDPNTDNIINASCTFITNMCNDFIKEIFEGHNLNEGIDAPIEIFEKRYFGLGKKAIISAMRDAYNQFSIYKSMQEN